MVKKYQQILNLAATGEHQLAYDELSELIEKNDNDYMALCYRGIIDFLYLKAHQLQTIKDFQKLVDHKTEFAKQVIPYLGLLYSMTSQNEQAIKYCEAALKEETAFQLDLYFALARAYYNMQDINSLYLANKYINKCLEMEPEEVQDFHVCKIDILISLGEFDEAKKLIDDVYTNFGASFIVYYLKGYLYSEMAKANDNNSEMIMESLNNLTIALQYEENNLPTIMLKIENYVYLGKTDEALKILETVKSEFAEDEYLVEVVKIYEDSNQDEYIIKLCRDYLVDHDSWRIQYSLAFFLSKKANLENEIAEVLQLYEKAYQSNPALFIFNEIYRINFIMKNDQANLDYINQALETYTDDGRLYYLKGETMQRLNYLYDDCIIPFSKSYELGYLDELRYLTIILPLVPKPRVLYKHLQKYRKMDYQTINVWMRRKMAIRYLYGEEGYPQNFSIAKTLLESCLKEEPEESCLLSTYGRYLELAEQNGKAAFETYQKAFQEYEKEFMPTCNCPLGYIAHCYLQGIGVETNEVKAQEIILQAVTSHDWLSSSTVLYLYSYFAMKNIPGFDLKQAQKYLLGSNSFYRYEITRAMMLKIIDEKLGEDSTLSKQMIKDALIYGDKINKKYYNKNKKLDIIYPAFNNY